MGDMGSCECLLCCYDFVLKNDIQLLTPSSGCIIAKSIEYSINGTTYATYGQLKPVRYLESISIALLTTAIADLNPFLRTQADYYDSPGVKQTSDFNYKYPSAILTIPANIPPIDLPVAQRFFKASEAVSSYAAAPADVTPAEFLGGLSQQYGISIPTSKIPQDADAGEKALAVPIELGFPDWRVRISVKKFEVDGSFSIFIFQGDVPADSDKWYYDPSLIGTFDVFISKSPATCGNCAEQRDKPLLGYVHLSRSILKNTEEGSLNKHVVLPHLEKLRWGVKKVSTV